MWVYHSQRNCSGQPIILRREIEREHTLAGIVGQSRKMRELFGVIRCITETDVIAMISGETGTGKELIARTLHFNSLRRAKRFVAVNCESLAETVLESEPFGHEKGGFSRLFPRLPEFSLFSKCQPGESSWRHLVWSSVITETARVSAAIP